jgi:Ni/Co efflux regulator RcnB
MKASFFSFVAAAVLFATTAASAAPAGDHDRDLRRLSPRERARMEQAQRARERQQAIERARWEAQHRHDRGSAKPYGHR